MKVFATRIPEPTPGHDTATAWRVAVIDDGETTDKARLFRSVKIIGTCVVQMVPDSEPPPHVFVTPDLLSVVLGFDGPKMPTVLGATVGQPAD